MGRTLTSSLYYGTNIIDIPDGLDIYEIAMGISGIEEVYIGSDYHSIALGIKESLTESYGDQEDVIFSDIGDDWFLILERALYILHNACIRHYEKEYADDPDEIDWFIGELWSPLDKINSIGWKISGSYG